MSSRLKFSELELKSIKEKLDEGVSNRAADTFILLGILFSIYGVLSTEIISKFDPSVTVWSNSWPRILFNGLPFFLLSYYFKKKNSISFYKKSIIWAITQPFIFVIACSIYVWPLMLSGYLGVYLYFHAANMFVITFGITFVAPSKKIMAIQVISYALFFLAPLLFLTKNDPNLSSMVINDFLCMTLGACVAGSFTYRLRKKIALMDSEIKTTLTPFVGNRVATAIYSQNLENLNNKSAYGLILSIDLRGYTQFIQHYPKDLTSNFMKEYHYLVSTVVGKYNGFIHKTSGDGHLISFCIMDETSNLSDIEVLKEEVSNAEERKAKKMSEESVKMFDELVDKYSQLKVQYGVINDLRIGGALTAGQVEIQIQGNQSYRQEMNINGETIVRSARLETYTKHVMSVVAPQSSMLIVSPEIIEKLGSNLELNTWFVENIEDGVRDYPDIKKLYYKIWKSKLTKGLKLAS